jgi:hypothetical protein
VAQSEHSTMNRWRGLFLWATIACASTQAATQQIEITPGGCGDDVRLAAKGARLSEVLKRLSETLGFQLQFEGGGDSPVDVDVSRPAPELVARLSPADSIMVAEAPDPRCPNRNRIVKVWVLPKAKDGAPSPSPAPSVRQAAQAPPPAPASAQYSPARLDEMSRKAKEMYDAYVKQHGVPPPTPEEEAAK